MLERGKDTVVNQTLISRRSQIESKRKFFGLKDVLVVQFGQHFLSSGRLSMFGSWYLSIFISKPSRFLVLQSSVEGLSSLFSS
jgi:hypothetical protein